MCLLSKWGFLICDLSVRVCVRCYNNTSPPASTPNCTNVGLASANCCFHRSWKTAERDACAVRTIPGSCQKCLVRCAARLSVTEMERPLALQLSISHFLWWKERELCRFPESKECTFTFTFSRRFYPKRHTISVPAPWASPRCQTYGRPGLHRNANTHPPVACHPGATGSIQPGVQSGALTPRHFLFR